MELISRTEDGLYRVVTDIEIRVVRSDLDGLIVEIVGSGRTK